MLRAVVAHEDAARREQWARSCRGPDVEVDAVASAEACFASLDGAATDLVLIQRRLLSATPEEELRRAIDRANPPHVVVVSGNQSPEESMRMLAVNGVTVVPEGCDEAGLLGVLESRLSLQRRPHALSPAARSPDALEPPSLERFRSRNPRMQRMMELARRSAPRPNSLLILGETGVGKEWLARSIHAAGPRSQGPFVAVNCGGFPEQLLESELFGYRKGAFTGAQTNRKGWFEVAHGGTLFLDEIGEMPSHLQVRLLRVLQDREIQPLGAEQAVKIDVRVIAATNRDVEAEIEAGRFRKDLYYRLGVVTLTVPPLRERPEDIEEITRAIFDELGASVPGSAEDLAPETLRALLGYSWPGNVRELGNVLERALLLTDGKVVEPAALPEAVQLAAGPLPELAVEGVADTNPEGAVESLAEGQLTRTLPEARKAVLAAFEREYLRRVLQETQGRVGEAARRAGIQPRSLFERLRLYGLRKEDFRATP